MKPSAKRLCLGVFLLGIIAGSFFWLLSREPSYRGRPVSQWAVDYSRKLYPAGTVPLSSSQKGVQALREMGPQKAATALVRALTFEDSGFYEHYRSIYPRLPAWYQNHFPLRLTRAQRSTLVLGATEFFEPDYQNALVPFLVNYLAKPDPATRIAASEVLAGMPQAALAALPLLQQLTTSPDQDVSRAAQAAIYRITTHPPTGHEGGLPTNFAPHSLTF